MATKNVKKSKRKERLSKTITLAVKQQVLVYDKWIVFLSAAILIALPLAISLISYDHFDIVKLAIFRILVAVIVIVWAVKVRKSSEPIIWSWREVLLGFFLFLLMLSTLFSTHFSTSLLGKYKRYEGLLTFITYIAMYFIVMQSFKNKNQLRLIIEVTSFIGGVVAIYGIFQYFGWDPINWDISSYDQRSFSTFGNPDLLAGYLVIAFSCSVTAYLNIYKRRWLHGFMVLLIGVCLYLSFTRGGWIGTLAALFCLAALLGWKVLKNRWRDIAIISLPALIVFVMLFFYSSTTFIDRLKPLINFKSSNFNRIEIWKIGLKMIKEKPLLGQGPDTFRIASEHFETKEIVRMGNGKSISDNAHNNFIQLAAGAGPIAAVLIYVFFISWIIRSIGLIHKFGDDEEEDHILISGVVSAVVGYLFTMFFEISVVGASSVFWLLLAAVAGYTYKLNPVYKSQQISEWPRSLKISLVTGVVILTTVSAGIAVSMYAGDIYFSNGMEASSNSQFDLASENFNKAATLYPGNGRFMYENGLMYQRLASEMGSSDRRVFAQYAQKAIEAYEKAVQTEPLEVDYLTSLSINYATIGRMDDAIKTMDKVLSRRPYSLYGHMYYGIYEQTLGNNNEALMHYEKMVDITPTQANPDVYLRMSDLYKKAGDIKKAAIYETAAKLNESVSR